MNEKIERKLACCSKDSCAVVCVIAQDLISHFMMNLVDIDTKPVLIHSEAQYYHAIVKMPSAKFSRICTDLSIFGDTGNSFLYIFFLISMHALLCVHFLWHACF